MKTTFCGSPLAWMALLFLLSAQPDIPDPFEIPDWLPADKLVHAGLYKYNRLEYTNDPAVNRTVPLPCVFELGQLICQL